MEGLGGWGDGGWDQAHDQQQQGLLDASAKALAYRKEVLDENLRLNQELEVRQATACPAVATCRHERKQA